MTMASRMDSWRLSRKSRQLYLTLFLVALVQLTFVERVHCREKQDPTNENVSTAKGPSEKDTTKADDSNDSLVGTKDSAERTDTKRQQADDMSSSNLIEKVTDKAGSNSQSDKDKVASASANQTKDTEGDDLQNADPTSDEEESDDSSSETDMSEEDVRASGQDYHYALEKIYQLSEKRHSLAEYRSKLSGRSNVDIPTAMILLREAAQLGYDIAKLVLAKIYFYGDYVEQDFNESYRLFHELSLKGNSDAHLYLGFMYSMGIGPIKSNQAKALLHYTFAALANSTFAQMALGYRYWSGISVASNCDYALSYYQKVAAKVEKGVTFSGSTSIQRIRLMEELENPGSYNGVLDDDLIQYYQFLADKGDVQAQVGLGQLHFQGGRGVELNPIRAFHYFKMAAESGNTNAMAFLGKMYLEGNKVAEKDYEQAYKYFKMAAEKGNPVGQSGLGIIYLYGKGVEKDFAMAFKYFSQAAIQGWVDGQLYLGVMYLKGYSVSKDPKSAIKYFTLASQSGHILGFYNLAEMHATGTGTMRSCSTAVELYKSVSERGTWGTTLMEAHNSYKEGNRANAFTKYAVLSELGYEVAQSNAAFLLDRNEIPEMFNASELHARAFMYWSRSATQGSSAARVKLGDYHYYGLGTDVDYEMAANQYRIASEGQNNAQALFNLGYMYETGLGLRRDIYLAKRYYDLAAVTSVEAQVPVALALIKLFFLFTGEYIQNSELVEILNWSPSNVLGAEWDMVIVSVLALILGTIFYLRRQGAG